MQEDFSFGDIGKAITKTADDAVKKVTDTANDVAKKTTDAAMKVKDEGEHAVHEAEGVANKVADVAKDVEKKVENGALWAYCHAKKQTMNQVHDWEDDWTHNAAMLSSGCGNGGDFTKCINAISETKNTEIIHGLPITYGDLITKGANIILPGSGAILEGASMGIDGTAMVSSMVAPSQLLMELSEADCEEPLWILQMLHSEDELLMNLVSKPDEGDSTVWFYI